MKFTVRAGFVIHDTRIVEIAGKPTEQTSSYYEGQTVEFDETTAQQHLHKLEPADRAATAFIAARFAPVAPVPTAGMDPAAVAALVAQAVASAMASVQASALAPQAPAQGAA